MTRTFCGVDLSARQLDARIGPDGPVRTFPRDAQGLAALAAFCRAHGVDLVAMEATGGYERLPFALLWAEGLPCAILNPRAVRRFAQAIGLAEKTDRIDTGVIARFAAVTAVEPQAPLGPQATRLKALVTRLGQITAARVAQDNQRRLVDDPLALSSIDEVVALLRAQVRRFETEIAALIAADPLWARLEAAFREIKGVAGRTVARLMADLPEIGTVSGKSIAKLVGLAPLACDSGQARGRRRIRDGRAGVRATLFVVAGVVRRYDPGLSACYARLKAAGKPPKVIRVALARKLLVILNAKARDARKQLTQAV